MLMRSFVALAAAGVFAVESAAAAQVSEPAKRIAADPNEKVCEKITVVGSRLATKRICATRAEWADRRRQEREAVDRAQTQIIGPCQTTGTVTGAASC
jgi:hypothetical protein